MATYTFTGSFDEVSAKLKASFDAQEADFNTSMKAMFKPAAPKAPAPAAPVPRLRPLVGPAPDAGCRLTTRRNDDDTLRGRMRSSLRSTSR